MGLMIRRELKPIFGFVLHVIIGSVMFFAVFGIAYLIGQLTTYALGQGNSWAEQSIRFLTAAIFIIDVLCFGLFLIFEAVRFVRLLLADLKDSDG